MANLILGNGEFGQGLKFEARDSSHQLSHGPVYGSAGYVALRNNDYYLDQTVRVITSTDGITWTEQAHNINLNAEEVRGLEYINGKYVVYGLVLAADQFNHYIKTNTSTDGINWTSYTSTSTVNIGPTAMTYANNLWQIFGTNSPSGNASYSSPDLINWTKRLNYNLPNSGTYTFTSASVADLATDGTTTVALGWGDSITDATGNYLGTETLISKSTNGTSWTTGSIVGGITGGGDGWKATGIAYGNSTWVVVGTTGKIYTSFDATTWTAATSGTTGNIFGVEFANGVFIAQRYSTNTIPYTVEMLKSTNGTTWTKVTAPVIESDDVLFLSNAADPSLGKTKPVYALGKWIVGNYQSTDNGVSWTILDFQVPNKQPFIKYPHESGWNTWKTMDFWVFIPSHPGVFTGMGIASERGSWTVYLETQANGTLAVKYRGYGINFADVFIHSSFVFGEWNHFRLVVDNGQASWYLNGTRRSTTSTGTRLAGNDTLNIGYSSWIAEGRHPRPVDYYIDEFMLTDDALNPTTATSITVPTAPFINTEATSILLHFDTDFNDDPSDPARSGSAAISSAFSEIIQINAVYKGAAALSSTASQTASVRRIRSATAGLTSTFNLSASALDLDLATANMSVASSLTASVGVIKRASSGINADTALDIANGRLVRAVGNLQVNAFELVAIARTQQFGAYIEARSSLTANAIKAADAPIAISSTSSLTALVGKRMVAQVAINATATMVTRTDKLISFISTEPVTASLDASATKIARTGAAITCVSSLDFLAANTQAGSGTLFNQCSMTVTAQAIKRIQLNLPATVEVLAITNNVVRAEANLVVTAFELTIAKAFNLDESAVWVVPVENTQWTIPKDNNDYLIALENREYKI